MHHKMNTVIRYTLSLSLGAVVLLSACSEAKHRPIDPLATTATMSLYNRLFQLRNKGVLLGHQDDIAYGHQCYEPGFSDIYDMTGDYPAVIGWEIGHVEKGDQFSLDSVYFNYIRQGIAQTHARGGISTISWHADNILTGGSTWDCSRNDVVASILPGESHHDAYLTYLNRIADFLLSLRDAQNEPIPIVLRLYHEQTQSWFWWGADYCSPEQYKALWQMTVGHLRDTRGVHNVLYAYSPADVADTAHYLERYPGDEWVDVVGFDLYCFGTSAEACSTYMDNMRRNLRIVTDYAATSGKLPIMAETGMEGIPSTDYFTATIAPLVETSPVAWILFWRNAWEPDKPNHFYLPYKGHPAEADFKNFIASDRILMNSDIQ